MLNRNMQSLSLSVTHVTSSVPQALVSTQFLFMESCKNLENSLHVFPEI